MTSDQFAEAGKRSPARKKGRPGPPLSSRKSDGLLRAEILVGRTLVALAGGVGRVAAGGELARRERLAGWLGGGAGDGGQLEGGECTQWSSPVWRANEARGELNSRSVPADKCGFEAVSRRDGLQARY